MLYGADENPRIGRSALRLRGRSQRVPFIDEHAIIVKIPDIRNATVDIILARRGVVDHAALEKPQRRSRAEHRHLRRWRDGAEGRRESAGGFRCLRNGVRGVGDLRRPFRRNRLALPGRRDLRGLIHRSPPLVQLQPAPLRGRAVEVQVPRCRAHPRFRARLPVLVLHHVVANLEPDGGGLRPGRPELDVRIPR